MSKIAIPIDDVLIFVPHISLTNDIMSDKTIAILNRKKYIKNSNFQTDFYWLYFQFSILKK